MIQRSYPFFSAALFCSAALVWGILTVRAQQMPGMGHGTPSQPKVSGEDAHGTTEGWKFNWPKGDLARGREVFVKLECYSCHEVKGEKFPSPTEKGKIGPELSAMGPLHDPEYFAEAIINPGAAIEKGKSYEAEDGSSKMPSFNDSVTVQEVVDLVAYLRGLKPPAETPAGPGEPSDGHGMPGMTGPSGSTRQMNH